MPGLRKFLLISCLCLLFALVAPKKSHSFIQTSPHLLLGNPTNAVTSLLSSPNNYLLIKPQYVLSYNESKSIPNWVSWQLNESWLGDVRRCKGDNRKDGFSIDEDLPVAISPVLPTDYKGSGFDRGHMIPSGDRTDSPENNCATFRMTNIIPQTPSLNRGPWETLENYARTLAKSGKELYIIAGGVGIGGENNSLEKVLSFPGYDSSLKITVPAICWKIILVLDRPGLGIKDIRPETRVIAVAMPQHMGTTQAYWNIREERGGLRYITSVKEIERLTGYDFFSNLPKNLQTTLEAKIDSGEV